jgi:hypothetical protein
VFSCHKQRKTNKVKPSKSKRTRRGPATTGSKPGEQNHHATLTVGGLLASTGKPGRKQKPLSPTRLKGRKQKPGGRHEASPRRERPTMKRDFSKRERLCFLRERSPVVEDMWLWMGINVLIQRLSNAKCYMVRLSIK